MTRLEAISQRHSVRAYKDKEIEQNKIDILENEINKINKENNLHLQLIKNDPKAFNSVLAHYGKFSNIRSYIALIGKKSKDLDQKCGFYGESLVLLAQTIGLNTCWVGLTFKKNKDCIKINKDEKLVCIIAVGYGQTNGVAHRIKKVEDICKQQITDENILNGLQMALLAPTAMNQQRFSVFVNGNDVEFKSKIGFFSKVDIGIVRYHFLLGSGRIKE
ncbi:MAG: nitroreductase family protein [Bacteroidales bacterium]